MSKKDMIIKFLEILIFLLFLKFNEIKNYFYPLNYFTQEEIRNLPIEIPLDNQLINLLESKNHIDYRKYIYYVNKYYHRNLNIKFNYLLDFYEIEFLFVIFLWPVIFIYVLYKYTQLKKTNNFKEQHNYFYELYKEKNLLNIKIYLTFILLITMFGNLSYNLPYILALILLYALIKITIIILYKHYLFICKLNKIHFITRDGITYLYKDELNKFLKSISNL